MTDNKFTFSSHTVQREILERFTNQWSERLCVARKFLFSQEWQEAVNHYWQAYDIAERLLKEPLCKNCAIKGYIRTLAELAYVMRKNQQQQKLPAIIELAQPVWRAQLTSTLVQELIAIVTNIAYAPIAQIDVWIDALFAMDTAVNQPLH